MYRWRFNAVIAIVTTVSAALRAALSFLDEEASVLLKMQLSLLAFCLVVVASFHLTNLKSRKDFVRFTQRYLAMAKLMEEGKTLGTKHVFKSHF